RRTATGRAAGVQQNRPRQGPVSFPFDPTCGAVPASNGGVHAGSYPVITKTLKKDDSVSLPMFRETLKILKRVSSFVSQCGKSG
ncbi:hypothetical protein, partial [Burkholderia sp. 4NA327B6]|uniref:hypothetical protein n=1 Tax=Burkholderia sp. 4NA327B6 TaxID=2502225 RepID=UPI001BB1B1E4